MKEIKHIVYIGMALLAAGCASEDSVTTNETPSGGGEKTPLRVEATISTDNGLTRAAGNQFETGDVLLAYLRHTTVGSKGSYTTTTADQAPKLVALKKGSVEMAGDATVLSTSDLTSVTVADPTVAAPLYWDDFSNSASAATDLRTSGHGLQSYYGYCYNGGTPTPALVQEAGTLGWTVATDQSAASAVKQSDLLWSQEQETVVYAHADTHAGDHRTLTIPYTHAMSEITVTVNCGEGFVAATNPLANTVLTLNGMNTVTSLTAPTGAFDSSTSTPTVITMCAEAYQSGDETLAKTRNFTAIVAPGTKLKEGTLLLNINGVDDNDYTLTVTSGMLDDATGWAEGHSASDPVQKGTEDGKKYVLTQPGVNYHLTVNLKKTAIETHATLADWKTVNATGTGDIVYPNDEKDDDLVLVDDDKITGVTNIEVVTVDKNKFANGASFSLFQLAATDANTTSALRTNDSYTYATIATFQDNAGDANDQWNNTPQIYWPNQSTNYYFRALAQFNSATAGVNSITSVGTFNTVKGTDVSQGTIATGHDILWGTTATHKGTKTSTTYQRGQAIPPRTGDVPIAFEHAMSKITFNLETESAADAAEVDLTDATIAISSLYTTGSVYLDNGVVSPTGSRVAEAIAPAASISELVVVPQDLANDAIVTITLRDGTVYKLQLNQCKSGADTIGTWEQGKQYVYTLHLEKELITFRVLVSDWTEVTGSGNANLEWD